jgi:hypothetical protein
MKFEIVILLTNIVQNLFFIHIHVRLVTLKRGLCLFCSVTALRVCVLGALALIHGRRAILTLEK